MRIATTKLQTANDISINSLAGAVGPILREKLCRGTRVKPINPLET